MAPGWDAGPGSFAGWVASGPAGLYNFPRKHFDNRRAAEYVKRSLGKYRPSRRGPVPSPPEDAGAADDGLPGEGRGGDRRGGPAATRPARGRRARRRDFRAARRRASDPVVGFDGGGQRPLSRRARRTHRPTHRDDPDTA